MKKCINCDYFITCTRKDKNNKKRNCEYYKRTFLSRFIKKIVKNIEKN